MYRQLQHQRDLAMRAEHEVNRQASLTAGNPRWPVPQQTTQQPIQPGQLVPVTPQLMQPRPTTQQPIQPGQLVPVTPQLNQPYPPGPRWQTPTVTTAQQMQPGQLVPVTPQHLHQIAAQRHPVVFQKPPPSLFPPMHQ